METWSPAPPQPWQRVAVASVPPGPPQQSRRRGTSAVGYAVGAGILVGGMLVALVWLFAVSLPDTSGFFRVQVPSDRQVELQARPYTLYDEYPSDAPESRRAPTVRITGPNGVEPITLAPADSANTYLTDDYRYGREIATVSPTVAGNYRVEVIADPVAGEAPGVEQVSIGDDLLAGTMGGFVGAVLLGLISLVTGTALIVVTFVRRNREGASSAHGRVGTQEREVAAP